MSAFITCLTMILIAIIVSCLDISKYTLDEDTVSLLYSDDDTSSADGQQSNTSHSEPSVAVEIGAEVPVTDYEKQCAEDAENLMNKIYGEN